MSTKFKPKYTRMAQLKTAEDFQKYLSDNNIPLEFENDLNQSSESPFGKSYLLGSGKKIGNRFCILPMEGWDGTVDGRPTEFTKRRWENFAISGAKLLWGCEAVAVRPEGRANPNQLMINDKTLPEFESLYQMLTNRHHEKFSTTEDLHIGLQLTHSGRFCKPFDKHKGEPQILYNHPVLDRKFGLPSSYPVMNDEEIDRLIEDFIQAAILAAKAGFHFVDVKHCHGYLGHEFLSAVNRPGKYGGSFENRTRFLRTIVEGIRAEAPTLEIGVRLSAFDWVPFKKGDQEIGVPDFPSNDETKSYDLAFGGDKTGLGEGTEEVHRLMNLFETLGIELVCVTAGSPYYNPHIQRPALFPPSDGYQPPEDPLIGVARQINFTGELAKAFPNLAIVGSAYSYLQEWLPNVAQHVLNKNMADFIGLGRMVLSYPDMPVDILKGKTLERRKICRTFSDCTTAPRNGLISGCYPLDPYYKKLKEAEQLKEIKSS